MIPTLHIQRMRWRKKVRKTRLPSIKANTHQQTEDQTQQIDGPYKKSPGIKMPLHFLYKH